MLTKRNIQVLRTILRYAKHYHAWPSLQEIAKRLPGTISPRAVKEHTDRLVLHGLVRTHHGPEGGQALTPQAYALLKAKPVTIAFNRAPRRIRASKGRLSVYTKARILNQRRQAALHDVPHLYQQ